MSLNSVNIMGNLTRDPELKNISAGKSVCTLSIANNRISIPRIMKKSQEVSYFDVDVWGASAENWCQIFKKGSGIIVEGRLKQDRWEKDGKTQSRVRITANSVHFMPKRSDDGGSMKSDPNSALDAHAADSINPEDIAWSE